jgi:carboxyl-terminal processing protease
MIPMTMGDEPGVANPLFKQMGMFMMGNPKVFLQALPAITLTSSTAGNDMNNPVGVVTVPSVTTVLFTQRAASGAAASTIADLVGLARRLDDEGERSVEANVGEDGLLTIAIRVFARGTASRVNDAFARASGATSVVFDVRGCPGGELAAAVEVLRDLLPAGAPIATVTDDEGDDVTYVARGDRLGLPVTVLVDERTASAAEVFARCLEARGRARVVGGPTYGKMTAQAAAVGDGGCAVARTVATISVSHEGSTP